MKMVIVKHILLWVIVVAMLVLYFGRADTDYAEAFYFVIMLMPVAVGTAYVFDYYLVPRFLLTKRYWTFALYMFYMLVFTLHLEMVVIVFSFITIHNFRYNEMDPLRVDTISVATTIYLIVFAFSFFRTIGSLRSATRDRIRLQSEIDKAKRKFLTVVSDRQQVPIPLDEIKYIESMSDYVRICQDQGKVITREKISTLEKSLPSNFVRVHRSFIINKLKVTTFNSEHVYLGKEKVPISRKYKKGAVAAFES